MRILHTSDWHLGHRLHEQSQHAEQELFLSWLLNFINQQQVDVLLVSGDIFDTTVPSNQSLGMYYDFLVNLRKTTCKEVIITGGNHDSPSVLDAPKQVLRHINVHVIGKSEQLLDEQIIRININNQPLIIAAAPYLRDQDIRRAMAGEDSIEIESKYKQALINHYQKLAELSLAKQEANEPIIAMGHLFAIGGTTSDSEQTIYVGRLGDIGADDFPDAFSYLALGHLHRFQSISPKVYYSGSPYMLSFSEVNNKKKLICLDVCDDAIQKIEDHEIPAFRVIRKIKGSVSDCLTKLQNLVHETQQEELTPWVELVLEDCTEPNIFNKLTKEIANWRVEVLKISLSNQHRNQSRLVADGDYKQVKDITPEEVFAIKCKEEQFDIDEHPEIKDLFNEIVQLAKQQ